MLKEQPEVREALKQATVAKRAQSKAPPPRARQHARIGRSLLLLATLSGLHYVVQVGNVGLSERVLGLLRPAVTAAMAVSLVLALKAAVGVSVVARLHDPVTRYNVSRVVGLVSGVAVAVIAVSLLFANWTTTLASLGVLSLIVGLAVQTPFTSFIGWIFIMVRQPFRVGDRIQIGNAIGDVIDVGYLDTTLWEVGGEYLATKHHPSGRIVKFPNSVVLEEVIYNFSWPLFPYIWSEIRFPVGYDADLKFVEETMQRIVEEELGERMMERVAVYRELLAQTPVDEVQVRERPSVFFRTHDNTWLIAIVRYLVTPKHAGSVKTRLIPKLVEALSREPDRVRFPKGDMR